MKHPEITSKAEEVLLIRASQGGDQDAARKLIDLHKDRLFSFVWRLVRNQHDAEDLCQEAFLRAFDSLDKFNEEYRFSTWLFTIGYRLALNCIRRRRHAGKSLDLTNIPADDRSNGQDVSDHLAASEQARQIKEVIWQEVDRLSLLQRATLQLFYREGWSCQQIAQNLGIPVSTVKSHMHRARANLRKRLKDQAIKDWTTLKFGD